MKSSSPQLRVLFDTRGEQLVTIGRLRDPLDASKLIPFTTVYRWVTRGKNGVKLPVVRVGRKLATTEAAMREFLAESTCPGVSTKPAIETPSQRRAAERLAAMGI